MELAFKMKKLVLGLLVGLMIGSAGTAFAAQNQYVQAVFSKFTLLVNGEYRNLEQDPLVYNGYTYLPVRTVSELLNYELNYNADTKTIILNARHSVPVVEEPESNEERIAKEKFRLNNLIKSEKERLTELKENLSKIENSGGATDDVLNSARNMVKNSEQRLAGYEEELRNLK